METWLKLGALSVGGSFGVNARYWLGVWINRWASPQFPWATFAINVSGSFLIGVLTIVLTRWMPHPNLRLLVITGFLGGYTTFSTFEFESATLWERGEPRLVVVNMVGSVVAGFVAVLLGIALARAITLPAAGPSASEASSGATAGAVSVQPPPIAGGGPGAPTAESRSRTAGNVSGDGVGQAAPEGRVR
jgi:CrcB protein